MDAGAVGSAVGPIMFFLFLGAVILTPIFLRNRLMARQLDAVTAALQHGIAPERVRESLMLRREEGDINGNWKAGQILTVIGWTYLPFGLIGALAGLSKPNAGDDAIGALGALLPGIICIVVGYRLLRIHQTIVGPVLRRGETAPAAGAVTITPASSAGTVTQ
jgi:hypothetical protein